MPLSSVVGAQSIVRPGVCTSSTKPASPYDGQVIYMTDVDQTAVWDGSQWTVLAPIAGGRNVLINGAFKIWQRGATLDLSNSSSSASYWADRWCAYRSANPTHIQLAYNSSGGPSNIPTFARIQRKNTQTSTEAVDIGTTPEITNLQGLVGKKITLSFYARAGSNFSAASGQISVNMKYGTGTTDSNGIWNTWTGQTTLLSSTATLTSSWQRFTYSVDLSSSATQVDVRLQFTPVGTAGANDYFDLTGVQLEVGAAATSFEYEDYGDTLAKCQRYYEKSYSDSVAPATVTDVGSIIYDNVGGGTRIQVRFSTTKRGTADITFYNPVSGSSGSTRNATASTNVNTQPAINPSQTGFGFDSGVIASGNIGTFHFVASAEL